jgi:hypothetical protein
MKKIARINSTPQVIQACLCIIRSILQVTQRVPPTCTIKHISRTRRDHVQCGMHRGRVGPRGKKKWVAQRSHGGKKRASVAMPEAVGGKRYTWKCSLLVCTVNGATDGATTGAMYGTTDGTTDGTTYGTTGHMITRGEQEGNTRAEQEGNTSGEQEGNTSGEHSRRWCGGQRP